MESSKYHDSTYMGENYAYCYRKKLRHHVPIQGQGGTGLWGVHLSAKYGSSEGGDTMVDGIIMTMKTKTKQKQKMEPIFVQKQGLVKIGNRGHREVVRRTNSIKSMLKEHRQYDHRISYILSSSITTATRSGMRHFG